MSILGIIRECLNCEKHFNPHVAATTGNVPIENSEEFCSLECYEALQAQFHASAEQSKILGLVDNDNNPLLSSAPSKESTAQQLLQHFHLKVNTKPKE